MIAQPYRQPAHAQKAHARGATAFSVHVDRVFLAIAAVMWFRKMDALEAAR